MADTGIAAHSPSRIALARAARLTTTGLEDGLVPHLLVDGADHQALLPAVRQLHARRVSDGVVAGSQPSFLLGYPFLVQRIVAPFEPRNRTWEPSVYVQDDWRATSWLTLNLGLRYEVFTPLKEAEDRLSNLDLDTGKILVAGQNGVSRTAGLKTDWSNVAPRVGFAATLGSTAIRGGWDLPYYAATTPPSRS